MTVPVDAVDRLHQLLAECAASPAHLPPRLTRDELAAIEQVVAELSVARINLASLRHLINAVTETPT